jgi:hypothetical protein
MRSRSLPGASSAVKRKFLALACSALRRLPQRNRPGNSAARQARAVLDRYPGTGHHGDHPAAGKSTVTSTSTSTWVLDHRYLRVETVKSDGSQELQIFGYDPVTKGYSLWIFSSTGIPLYLSRGEWNESTRTMSWKSSATDQISYTSRCTFEAADTLRCISQVKNFSGAVVVDVESVGVRRRP